MQHWWRTVKDNFLYVNYVNSKFKDIPMHYCICTVCANTCGLLTRAQVFGQQLSLFMIQDRTGPTHKYCVHSSYNLNFQLTTLNMFLNTICLPFVSCISALKFDFANPPHSAIMPMITMSKAIQCRTLKLTVSVAPCKCFSYNDSLPLMNWTKEGSQGSLSVWRLQDLCHISSLECSSKDVNVSVHFILRSSFCFFMI